MSFLASLFPKSVLSTLAFVGVLSLPGGTEGGPSAQEIVSHWRSAIHAESHTAFKYAVIRSSSDQDGIQGETEQRIAASPGGETDVSYRETMKRRFDDSEIVVTHDSALRRDWNGWVRDLEGPELARLRSGIFETRTIILGPSPEMANAAVSRSEDGKSFLLSLTPAGGTPMTFTIDAATWLPLKSERRGEDGEITTTYKRWGEMGGAFIPREGQISETEKPSFRWTRTSLRFESGVPDGAFAAPRPGTPDAHLDAGAPPIPFAFESNHILFKVSVNGREPAWFIFDTGADENVIHAARLADFGLKIYAKSAATGGGGSAEYDYAADATFTLPGVVVRHQHVAAIDQGGLERALGVPLGGILGYDFISRFVLEIDYAKRLITLHDPKTWSYAGSGAVVPITFDQGIPHMDGLLSVAGRPGIPARLVMDFGAGETMTLTSPFVKANDLLNLVGTNTHVNRATVENQFFSQTNVRGRIDRLAIGPLTAESIPVNLSVNVKGAYANPKFAGTVGETIYSRYHVYIDYARRRAIFEPTAEAAKPFPERQTYGLTLVASGADLRTFTVTAVRPGSPAESDGFRKDDVVAAFDSRPAQQFALGELRDWLLRADERHAIQVARGGERLTMTVDIRLVSIDAK